MPSGYTSRFTGGRNAFPNTSSRSSASARKTDPPATPKAAPASNGHQSGHFRLRYDRLDIKGRMSIRRAGRMHHLGIGTTHARKRVLAFADDDHITVAELTTGEVLSTHLIEPNQSYWRNQTREPGRWPSPQNRDL